MDTPTQLLLILLLLHLVHCLAFPLDPLPWLRPAHLQQSRCTAKRLWPHTTLSTSAGGKNEGPVGNPCNRICRYNPNFFDGQVCIGCFRDAFEIRSWKTLSASERSWVLQDAKEREEEWKSLEAKEGSKASEQQA
ncbi:hypothetical protein GUITHDRAFT_107043 [Guillardia theta CCMP2712]|uniref:A20-type domain-containing protein n=1 Tax=Guillardia theta (strain CCMP2712) TaxID=905079 RepID=L1JFM7_GUITC|nr:hypothetical protein GUITHDRAFT_107043 [Guillardia theta CCMP2712]EKX47132.1 hypothetical protein GUITHDRAFT_107043 [Guillardia theta CCMP2712]|eukprot:XP_005834112.1 hypothetical protein GUITHDRAFT_107043 [Guillardia theta CCMP2712]